MNYELAKRLKEEGFPFKEIKVGYSLPPHWECFDFNPEGKEELGAQHFYMPTLRELIEACGEIFCGIHRLQIGGWIAFIYDIEDSTRQVEAKGSTPDEAVANLWLILNQK